MYDVTLEEKDKLSAEQIQEKFVTERHGMNSRHGNGCIDGISVNESESCTHVSTTSEVITADEVDSQISCNTLSDVTQFNLGETRPNSSLTSALLNSDMGTHTEMCQSNDVSLCSSQTDRMSGSESRNSNCFPSALIQSVDAAINTEQDSYNIDSNERPQPTEACYHAASDICVSVHSSGNQEDTCLHSGSLSSCYMLPEWPDNHQMNCGGSKRRELNLDNMDEFDHISCSGSDANLDCNSCDSSAAVQVWSPDSDVIPPHDQVYYGTGSDYIYIQ